jgi:MoaA/NifB/PqqE/SkfB family radical SAM enzyme
MNIRKKITGITTSISAHWQNILINTSLNSSKPLNKPTSIIFNLTPNCILKCRQCDIWKNPPEKHLSFNEAKIIIDKLHSWLGNCYIFFTGGEPLMNPNLPKIIGYAYSKGIISHINSNAVLIDQAMAKKLTDNHLFAISISLDGANSKTHDYLRGVPGTFNRAIQAIKYLQKTIHPPMIYINTVIMKKNVKELQKLINITQKNKTNGITFQCLLPNLGHQNNALSLLKNPLWPNKLDVASVLKKIIKTSNPLVLTTETDLKTAIKYYRNPLITNHQKCAAGTNNFIINHRGKIQLCFGFPEIGNLIKENPQDIWWGQLAQHQRKAIRNCQQNCKIIVCNKVDTKRKQIAINLFK